jgi:hypothetical protein
MNRRTLLQSIPALAFLSQTSFSAAQTPGSVFELRIYLCYDGKLPDLLTRFREHTTRLFEKHGMKNIAYWTPTDDPIKDKTLIYVLSHPSREAATANWKAFVDDPDWIAVRDKSEATGKIVEKVDSTFMTLTDFSPKI